MARKSLRWIAGDIGAYTPVDGLIRPTATIFGQQGAGTAEFSAALVGHTWSQSALDTEVGGELGDSLGDAIERWYTLKRVVGRIEGFVFPFLLSDQGPFGSRAYTIRAGLIVNETDGELGHLEYELHTEENNDLEAPWLWTEQRVAFGLATRNRFNDDNNPVFQQGFGLSHAGLGHFSFHFDINVGRAIGPMDVLGFRLSIAQIHGLDIQEYFNNAGTIFAGQQPAVWQVTQPVADFTGYIRTLVST